MFSKPGRDRKGIALFSVCTTMILLIFAFGAKSAVDSALDEVIEKTGRNVVRIYSSAEFFDGADVKSLETDVSSIVAVAGETGKYVFLVSKRRYDVVGVTPGYFDVRNMELEEGREPREEGECVIGNGLKKLYFGDISPIGKEIECAGRRYKIVGILKKIPDYRRSDIEADYTLFKMAGSDEKFWVIWAKIEGSMKQAAREIEKYFEGKGKKVHVEAQSELYSFDFEFEYRILKIVFALLGICVVLTGFNVTNTFLILIAKRYREIGIKRALGASKGRIYFEVFKEACAIIVFGTILGVIVAYVFLLVVGEKFPFALKLNWKTLLYSLTVVASTGMAAVLYPAAKASTLDPVEAINMREAKFRFFGKRERAVEVLVLSIGIIVSLACFVITESFKNGTIAFIDEKIKEYEGQFVVKPGSLDVFSPLRPARYLPSDALYLEKNVEEIEHVAILGGVTLERTDDGVKVKVHGVDSMYALVNNFNVEGQFITDEDVSSKKMVAVVSEQLAESLNLRLGHYLKVSRYGSLKIKGIVRAYRGNDIFVPFTLLTHWKEGCIFVIRVREDVENISEVERKVVRLLKEKYPENSAPVVENKGKEYAEIIRPLWRRIVLLFTFIVGIILIVGNAGVANLAMLNALSRKREMGVRMVVGASRMDIYLMLLGEIIWFYTQNGIVGLLGGLVGIKVLSLMAPDYIFNFSPILGAKVLLLMIFMGLICGFLPAYKTSKMDIAEAVRSNE